MDNCIVGARETVISWAANASGDRGNLCSCGKIHRVSWCGKYRIFNVVNDWLFAYLLCFKPYCSGNVSVGRDMPIETAFCCVKLLNAFQSRIES